VGWARWAAFPVERARGPDLTTTQRDVPTTQRDDTKRRRRERTTRA
jgi:hypothetical protein